MSGALEGVRVLDFSTLLPGPMATLYLAEAGADVIKIENPRGGDEMRRYQPLWGDMNVNFHMLNRGKKSLALDLKSPEAMTVLRPLIAETDVLIEQFRPGVMARLGLSYADLVAIKPDIIYCSITGYGQTGPAAMRAGHDLNYQGDTGLLAVSLGSAAAPVVPPALIADIAGGTYPALLNILMALYRRSRSGEGAYLDIAMAENLFPFLYWAQGQGQTTGSFPGNGDALVTGGTPRYRLYPTLDGRFAAVAAIEQKFWEAFCAAIGLAETLRDDSIDPAATTAGVAALIAGRSAEDLDTVFVEADCCCSIVRSLTEAMADPQFEARGVFNARVEGPEGKEIGALPVALAPEFRANPSGTARAPALGEH